LFWVLASYYALDEAISCICFMVLAIKQGGQIGVGAQPHGWIGPANPEGPQVGQLPPAQGQSPVILTLFHIPLFEYVVAPGLWEGACLGVLGPVGIKVPGLTKSDYIWF